jgi:MFS family permease
VGFLSPGIPLLKRQYLPDLTEDQEGNLGSLMLLSATLANPLAAFMADSRLGRKGTVMLTAIPFVICFALNALMPASLGAHYVARLVVGQSIIPIIYSSREIVRWECVKEWGNDFAIWCWRT